MTSTRPVGAQPEGAVDRESAGMAVQRMFDEIAPRYDLLNHVLSANTDRLWWWRAARTFDSVLRDPQARVLDLCCGTGDMTVALAKRRPQAKPKAAIVAADFSHQMLRRGAAKFAERRIDAIAIEADALRMPFPSAHFQLVISAFGFRNLADYDAGLAEIARVLAPGGHIGILDFSEPTGVVGKLYRFYFRQVLPRIGGLISGNRDAYAYLPESVGRFPTPPQMLERMRRAGFTDVSWTAYSLGIAGLYRGIRA